MSLVFAQQAPIEHVFIMLDAKRPGEQVASMLPVLLQAMNWQAHLILIPQQDASPMEAYQTLLDLAAKHVQEHAFCRIHTHIVLDTTHKPQEQRGWEIMLSKITPFQQRAYELQSDANLLMLPLLRVSSDTSRHAIHVARMFRKRFAEPSIIWCGPESQVPTTWDGRSYLATDTSSEALLRSLTRNHLFESALAHLDRNEASQDALTSCTPYLILDENKSLAYRCLHDWRQDQPLCRVGHLSAHLDRPLSRSSRNACSRCLDEQVLNMDPELRLNRRVPEGRRLHMAFARKAASREAHLFCERHAKRALAFSEQPVERAQALMFIGLSAEAQGRLEEAEEALSKAQEQAEDPGIVAFYRGRVQFAWRDYIEALERFEEALRLDSKACPREELYLMAVLSHLHLEEYPEAQAYMEPWAALAPGATVSYYQGLIVLGLGDVNAALQRFQESLEQRPQPHEMGSVLFYKAHCLKEMGDYQQARNVLLEARIHEPEETRTLNLLGFCHYQLKEYAQAAEVFTHLLSIDPKSAIDHASLASNLRELGRIEEAIQHYEEALRLDPYIGFARENLKRLRSRPRQ